MSDINATTNGNGNTNPTIEAELAKASKGPTVLQVIRDAWTVAGRKADPKEAVKLRDAYVVSTQKLTAAEKALNDAREANWAAAKALAEATGAGALKFGGVLYEPSCRGERIFYKAAGAKDVLEIK